jgi:hypothetical protein
VAVEVVVTTLVVTVTEALVAPAPIVTDPGTTATELLLESATVMPPLGAGPVRLTEALDVTPPATLVGSKVTLLRAAGTTVSVNPFDTPSAAAVTVTDVEEVTLLVVTVNVFEVVPEAMVIEPGTVATAVLLLASVMTCPLAGAAALSLTVAVTVLPPVTVVENAVTEATPAAKAGDPIATTTNISTAATTAPKRLIFPSPLRQK